MELEKIETLFKSSNKADWKYAQRICHALNIDYYVVSYKSMFEGRKHIIIYYTTNEPKDLANDVVIRVDMGMSKEQFMETKTWHRIKLYKIKLNKNGRKINEVE